MDGKGHRNHGAITRSSVGPSAAEAFTIIAIATILITRLYLRLTGYPQIGGGDLHIAHALYGGALMMLALLTGWLVLGLGARMVCVVLGGIGFGLFLDEVGKFVTKTNDYFYGPAAEIMYILVVIILVGARVVRDFRPLSARESLASAALIAADGVARGLALRRREIGLALVDQAGGQGRRCRCCRRCAGTSGVCRSRIGSATCVAAARNPVDPELSAQPDGGYRWWAG